MGDYVTESNVSEFSEIFVMFLLGFSCYNYFVNVRIGSM